VDDKIIMLALAEMMLGNKDNADSTYKKCPQ
jgi:hypothetical protein